MHLLIAQLYAEVLRKISKLLGGIPTISDLVWQDLTGSAGTRAVLGASGMSADQVIRAAIVEEIGFCNYEEPAFHPVDSRCHRAFCRPGFAGKAFKKSILNSTIK